MSETKDVKTAEINTGNAVRINTIEVCIKVEVLTPGSVNRQDDTRADIHAYFGGGGKVI